MWKLLIISGLFINHHPDTLIKSCTTDSCRKSFIRNLVIHFENSFSVITIDSCGKKWEEVVPMYAFYNYYVRKMKMDFKGYTDFVTDDLHNGSSFDRCKDSVIRGWRVNAKFVRRLNKVPIEKILKKYFDENRYLKDKYWNYEHEIIYSCYKKLIRVDDNYSQPAFYILKR